MTATGNGAPGPAGLITRDTPVYAAETGLKAPIQTGEMSTAYLSEMCVNYFGRNFFTAPGWSASTSTRPTPTR